mgnify:FL=1
MRTGFDFLRHLLSLIGFAHLLGLMRDTAHSNLEGAYPTQLAAPKTRMEACV